MSSPSTSSCNMEGQDELVIRMSNSEEVGCLDDSGYNADMYVANQEVVYD